MTDTALQTKPADHKPVFETPLQIVRPTFPPLEPVLEKFRLSAAAGQVTNNGPWVQAFERCLEAYLGVPAVAFSSGQAALMAMVRAAGVDGGEVVVPSMTFSATPHAVVWCGAEPVFADMKEDLSFGLDPADVERRITDRTAAILAVDPYGIACDYEGLGAVARRHGLKLLVDSAAAFGTKVGGRLVGGFADAQIFSFHATKAFNTMEGGCLCSNDAALIARARTIRNFGQTVGGDCSEAGFNGKMTEICALIGIEQLKTFDAVIATRTRAVERMVAGLRTIEGLKVACAPAGQAPVWLYLPVILDPDGFGGDRDAVCDLLARENLHARKYYSPACHLMTAYAGRRAQPPLPAAEHAAQNVIALPVYNDMTDGECDGIVEAFRRAAAALWRKKQQ